MKWKSLRFTRGLLNNRKSLILLFLSFLSVELMVQNRLYGTVTANEDGEPLPGVSIVIKGTSRGTTTDLDGKFALENVVLDDVLTFSYIGFKSEEISVGNQTTFDVKLLPDLEQLEEVVVIGYGTQERKDVTGAIASVSGEDIQKLPVANVQQCLQGLATGVQVTQSSGAPGGDVTVRIRGLATMGVKSATLISVSSFFIIN